MVRIGKVMLAVKSLSLELSDLMAVHVTCASCQVGMKPKWQFRAEE